MRREIPMHDTAFGRSFSINVRPNARNYLCKSYVKIRSIPKFFFLVSALRYY